MMMMIFLMKILLLRAQVNLKSLPKFYLFGRSRVTAFSGPPSPSSSAHELRRSPLERVDARPLAWGFGVGAAGFGAGAGGGEGGSGGGGGGPPGAPHISHASGCDAVKLSNVHTLHCHRSGSSCWLGAPRSVAGVVACGDHSGLP